MLASRNITSHIYDDAQAAKVLSDIRERYLQPLTLLSDYYKSRILPQK